ncbi:MAG: NADH-quinone oxidoreductase subunit NuoG [Desulfuromonadaceae bacterium]|nr:NADH-quinone oxidoreductase subunit NuoG [Desulfuromonadaceae bacterium]
MPTLTIDNQTVTVADGTTVIQAAERLGLVIPHFCYHEALGAAGACRLCAVKIDSGPIKGIQMACMVPAQDGMVVTTLDPEAVEFRAHVAEWAMTDHPHDCPVCDEGGECQLQEMTIAAGHGTRRFRGLKRTYPNQDLGPFIVQEMNRCIQCYRCVRTYRDYCGGTDYGTFGSRNRVAYGRVTAGRLASPFSGNIIDVCPTGVLTDKTFRFKCRSWDLQEAPSVCPHCSLGCNTLPGGRYRELLRVKARVNRAVNGFFICDRGRFGHGYQNHPQRLREPHVDGESVSWNDALAAVHERISQTIEHHGHGTVAFLGSCRATLEANLLLGQWAAATSCTRTVYECHPEFDRIARTVTARLGDQRRSLGDIQSSDFILLIGAEPLAEAPLLALAIRQAERNGARIVILDPRPPQLPCSFEQLPLTPEQLQLALEQLATNKFKGWTRDESTTLRNLGKDLTAAQNPVIIGAGALLGAAGIERLFDLVDASSTAARPCGVLVPLSGPNSYASGLLSNGGPDFDDLLDAILNGTIKALVCLETDPFEDYPQHGRAQSALAQLENLIVLDALPTETTRHAEIVLPTTVPVESDGCYINHEGRLQAFAKVLDPGLSVAITGGGDHPPRTFEQSAPGSLPRPAWAILAEILNQPTETAALRQQLARTDNRFAALTRIHPAAEGEIVTAIGIPPRPQDDDGAVVRSVPGSLQLWPIDTFGGADIFATYSVHLDPLRDEPYILLADEDAQQRGLTDGADAVLTSELGHLRLRVRCTATVPAGIAFLPHLLRGAASGFVPGGGALSCTLKAVEGEA